MRRPMLAAVSAVIVGLSASAALAQEAPDAPAVTAPAPAPDAFEQAIAASRVADFARRQKDPQAFIVAARMLQEIPMQDGAAADPDAPPAPFSAEALYDEARALAGGDPQLLMQINLAENAGSRGVLSSVFGAGLLRIVRDVSSRQVFTFPVTAKGGELLRIGAIGNAGNEIGMRLRDKAGRLLCDVGGDFAPVCSIRPKKAGEIKVEVLNRGSASTRAVILSN